MTQHPLRLVAATLAMAAAAVVLLWALYLARGALIVVYVSLLLAIGLAPFVNAAARRALPFTDRPIPRWLAILAIYVIFLGLLTVVGLMIFPPLVDQAGELWRNVPGWWNRVQVYLMNRGIISHRVTLEEAVRQAPGTPGDAVGTVAMALSRAGGGLFAFITVLVLTFYLLLESESLSAGFARLFSRDNRPRVQQASKKISAKVSAWLSGQLILAGTIGITTAIGLSLLGVPYYYVLGVISAVGEMIPVVGPVLSAVPAAIVAATMSTRTMVLVIVFFLVQQQLENHLLVPKVMQRQVGVSPVIVIVALLIGGSTLGIIGAVLAIPTAAVIQVIAQEILEERDRSNSES